MKFIIFKAAFHFNGHMLFVLTADSEPEPHPVIIVLNIQTVPNTIIAFFSFIKFLTSWLFIEITAIIVCLIHSNNLFAVKCILDAANVTELSDEYLLLVYFLRPFQSFILLQKPHMMQCLHAVCIPLNVSPFLLGRRKIL